MNVLYLDLETYSATPITHGTYKYVEHAEIMLFAYAQNNEPAQVLDLTVADYTAQIQALLDKADTLVAHNSMFDRTVLNNNGFKTSIEKWHDTMVQALSVSLQGALGDLCDILKISADHAKDKDGTRLIQVFCKPRGDKRNTRLTHPNDWAKFVDYARRDIEAMRDVYTILPTWNYRDTELKLWHLDQRINDRGVCVDTELVRCAMLTIASEKTRLSVEAKAMTGGQVENTTQRDSTLNFILKHYGIELDNLQKSTVEAALSDDSIPEPVKELLRNRLQASTSSTAKYKSLNNAVNGDGRLRGTLQFNGAMRTGRWSGRTFQPQNLPRPALPADMIELGIHLLKMGAADLLTDNLMKLLSSAIRGCIVAPAGKKLVVSDLSNIEGRVQAWLAGETWKIQAFKAFDKGTGHDLYKLAYAKSFGIRPEDVTKEQRQIGKVMELALGYSGGVGAFVSMALAYGIDLDDLADKVYPTLPMSVIEKSKNTLEWVTKQKGVPDLRQKTWLAIDGLKVMWRDAHPRIVQLWHWLDENSKNVVLMPNIPYRHHKLTIQRNGMWLRIRLPSGRYLCYPNPMTKDNKIFYKGVHQYRRKWEALSTYGGKLFENICQAVARDVLAANMQLIENAGYQIVLTIHDEVICEAPDRPEFNAVHLSELLATAPDWAYGLPLSASGFESYRYKKD